MSKFGAIDIGGTNSRLIIFDDNKNILFQIKIRTDIDIPSVSLMPLLSKLDKENIEMVAFCLPGPSDFEKGKIINPPTMSGWHDFDIKTFVKKNSKVKKMIFENDANAMAIAVHHEFHQSKKDITQFFTISTGLGAGLVIDNKIMVGSRYFGQEIAFLPSSKVEEKNIEFVRRFGVETFSAGSGLEFRAKARGKNWQTKDIFANYKKDPIATELIDDGIEALGNMISISLAFINPNLVVFAGSVALHNKWYINKAIEYAKTTVTKTQWNSVEFEFTSYGDNTAMYGLYHLAKSQ